jgi:hypothetical protein
VKLKKSYFKPTHRKRLITKLHIRHESPVLNVQLQNYNGMTFYDAPLPKLCMHFSLLPMCPVHQNLLAVKTLTTNGVCVRKGIGPDFSQDTVTPAVLTENSMVFFPPGDYYDSTFV